MTNVEASDLPVIDGTLLEITYLLDSVKQKKPPIHSLSPTHGYKNK